MKQSEWAQQEETAPLQLPAQPDEPVQLEDANRRLTALQAENRRLQTQVFAYERAMLALRRENDELEQQCEQLRARVDKLHAQCAAKPATAVSPLAAQDAPRDVQAAQTELDRISAQLLEEFERILPGD